MPETTKFRIVDIELHERPIRLRLPFRFGSTTLYHAPQAFVRLRIETENGGGAWGTAAEMLAPKWFDKDPDLTNENNFDQLRLALHLAGEAYRDGAFREAFDHFAVHYHELINTGQKRGLNRLVTNFGPALLDRAALDALCRYHGISFYKAIQGNLSGIKAGDLLPENRDFDFDGYLAKLTPSKSIAARHTVGLLDPIDGHPSNVNDGLPESLEEIIAAYGNRWFKIKLSGNHDSDIQRLQSVSSLLERTRIDYRITLDGNEQYSNIDALNLFWKEIDSRPELASFCKRTAYIEQPLHRDYALSHDVTSISKIKPVIIDESDDALDAFPRARELGYDGVSTKCCKGFYKSIINHARCCIWSHGKKLYFLSAEDLLTQAGPAVQQDLALVSLLGLTHVERNGHHYVNGMAGVPDNEQADFLNAHPDLYEQSHGSVRVKIRNGQINTDSLDCRGFASAAIPDTSRMPSMPLPVETE